MRRKESFARKIRWLNQVIILSCSLNFIFLSIFFYFLIRKSPFPCTFAYHPAPLNPESAKKFTNIDTLRRLASLPYDKLTEKLKDVEAVEEGYLVRDLALAILVGRDHFDLPRSLGRRDVAMRLIKLNEKSTLALYPGLKDADYHTLLTFLEKERFPLTSKGLFLHLMKKENDPILLQACQLTSEFLSVELLFKEAKPGLKKQWLLAMLAEGKWEMLATFSKEQAQKLDLSWQRRLAFLQDYLKGGSKTAASLLLLTDYDYCLKKASDETVCALLDLLPADSKRGMLFASELLQGARGDLVHQKAKLRLPQGEVAQIRPPRAAVGQLRPTFRDKPPSSPSPKEHVIQTGESLWTIARKYNVPLEELKRKNALQTEVVRVGKTLKIP